MDSTTTTMANIFDQVRRKGQLPPVSRNNGGTASQTGATSATIPATLGGKVYQYGNGATKVVDPVVAQLKEKRRLEKEKKEQEMRQKKGLAPKTSSKPSAPRSTAPSGPRQPSSSSSSSRSNGSRNQGRPSSTRAPLHGAPLFPSSFVERKPPAKKLNFNDLMKKASTIDQATLALSIKGKSKSPEHTKPVKGGLNNNSANEGRRPTLRDIQRAPHTKQRPPSSSTRTNGESAKSRYGSPQPIIREPVSVRAPIPVRGPSAHLLQKLKSKKEAPRLSNNRNVPSIRNGAAGYDDHDNYSDDDELDSFVVDDEEEEEEEYGQEQHYGQSRRNDIYSHKDTGYDRDEIWAMFNRGRKRSYYNSYDDYDSDDMEATGAEILEEETRSRRQAEVEDRRELEEEKRRAAMKRARYG